MTNWAVPEFSRNQVDRAGCTLIDPTADFLQVHEALKIINNWRLAHSYPLLHFRINLTRNARSVQPDAVIAQRIKRLDSISAKLRRQSTQLSQMQDIGGYRAIVKDIQNVNTLVERYKKAKPHMNFATKKIILRIQRMMGTVADT